MSDYQQRQYIPFTTCNNAVITTLWQVVFRSCRVAVLTVLTLGAVALTTGDWGLRSAMAERKPPLVLNVTGPQQATASVPVDGINVRIVNPGQSEQCSRLRLFVHDEQDRELRAGDIKIDNLEKNAWTAVPLEAIDGGFMGAIGAEGSAHKEHHKRGGFVIVKRANKTWRLRVTFRLPGRYALVIAVSPDNGATQLAKPAKWSVEVL